MSASGICSTSKLHGAPPPLEKVREPNFFKIIKPLFEAGFPRRSLRRLICVDIVGKSILAITTGIGTIGLIYLISSQIFKHMKEIGISILALVAIVTIVKIGQHIHNHFKAWQEIEMRDIGINPNPFLPKGSLRKYIIQEGTKAWIKVSYLAGSLMIASTLGSFLSDEHPITIGAFLMFDLMVIILAIGVAKSAIQVGIQAWRRRRNPEVNPDVEMGVLPPPPPTLASSLLKESLPPPNSLLASIPSGRLSSLPGLRERELPAQSGSGRPSDH